MARGVARAFRWLLAILGVVLVVVVAASAGLWWWAGTEHSLQWTLGQLSARQPLVVEEARGSLRTGVQAARMEWKQDGLAVEARDVELAWQPLALLRRMVRLDHVRAGSITVVDTRPPTQDKPQPPESLALPVKIAVDEVKVGRIEYRGAQEIVAEDLSARYLYDGQAHDLALRSLQLLGGHYRGEMRLGDRGPMPLQARLEGRVNAPVPGVPQALALVFDAQAEGPLADLQARLNLQQEPGSASVATQATATARITPWAATPLQQADVSVRALDVGALWPQAPHTSLTGTASLAPAGTETWSVAADLENALPGPWDRKRLPASSVQLEGEWRLAGTALVRRLDAQVGGGRVQAQGQWQGEQGWTLEATLAGIDPAALHTRLAPVRVGGQARASASGEAIDFQADLQAQGRAAASGEPTELAAAVGALELRSLRARGRWAAPNLSLPELAIRTADASLDAVLDLDTATQLGRGHATLQAPGLQLRGAGSIAPRTGGGTVKLAATDLALAQRWLGSLPGVPAAVAGTPLAGEGQAQFAWQGGWGDPSVQGTVTAPRVEIGASEPGGTPIAVRDATVQVDGRLSDARLEAKAKLQSGQRQLALAVAGRGGQKAEGAWQGQVSTLDLGLTDPGLGAGTWQLGLSTPVDARWAAGRLEVGAGEATLAAPSAGTPRSAPVGQAARPGEPARLSWTPIIWREGELRTAGRLEGLPMGWIERAGGPQLAGSAFSGDLVFDAQWDAVIGDTLRLQASLARRLGDLAVLAETAEGGSVRVPAGVRDARLTVQGQGEALTATLRWDTERAGTAEGRLGTRLARTPDGGWTWLPTAPLDGRVQAQLPRLGVWSVLAPPGWRLRGSLAADLVVAGTRAEPLLTGTLSADDLALRSIVDGIELQGGRLRARLDGRRLLVDEFTLRGPGGADGGLLTATGEGALTEDGPQVQVRARLQRLRASVRQDRQLTISGNVVASVGPAGAEVTGDLRVDQARIQLPDETAPRLGDDVVVRNAPGTPGTAPGSRRAGAAQEPSADGAARPVKLAVTLDMGNDFRLSGRGIQTRLEGQLTIGGTSLTEPRLNGTIRTEGGEYRAYGQRLDIERGVLRFTGPIDNPALDILAIRPRLAQRVGVQITGRAQAPFVQLYSEPDLPQAEKLSWLVLGRASASGGAEAALLQQAATALLASRAGGGTGRGVAGFVGLDELSFSRAGPDGPAVTLGKRLGENLYATYERSLSGALGTLFLFYDITQRITIRAQAGSQTAVDLIFTFRYD